ncbi:phospholipase A [Moraxella catarrhalis]|uniref:phospholipase A n=1 Tax=Moraxella catarrhalis TaxID=480 RepID=UPI00128E9458|nr:phospholipase A [Moraxella catarrhalis]MPY08022.1 phospholipase [Moraxella catarrhalis]
MKVSLSTLTLSILPCFAILAIQQAQAVPNPVAFVDEVHNENHLEQDNELPIDVQSATQSASTDTANPLDEHEPGLYTTALENKTMLVNCSVLNQDTMRLACYDTLVHGETPAVIKTKRSIRLDETIWQTIKGKPQVVYQETIDPIILMGNEQGMLTKKDAKQLEYAAKQFTPLSLSFDLDRNNTPLWSSRPHNPMYVLPIFMHGKPNRSPNTPSHEARQFTPNEFRAPELKFQVSVKVKAAEDLWGTDSDLWFGYTQQSHWQIFNGKNSRPFRVHDYQPEIFLTQPVYSDLPWDGKVRMIGMGAVHHSNGESAKLSRSWNRAYLMAGMEWKNLTVMPRIWGRIFKEGSDRQPDDNPDILDYYGYGDVRFLYQLENKSNISGTVRYNPRSGKGALQLDYVYPLGKGISGYVQIFQGYGQSLIDYNHEATSFGVGLMLNDWMGL